MTTATSTAGLPAVISDIAALVGRQLQHLRRAPGKLLGVTLTPVTMVLVLGYMLNRSITLQGNESYLDYMMAGAGAQVGLAAVGSTALGMAADLRNGLVDRFRSLPIAHTTVLVGRTVSDLLLTAIGIGVAAAVGFLIGWRTHTGLWSTLAGFGLLLLLAYALLWVGVLLGLLVSNVEVLGPITGLVLVGGSFLSNAFVPLQGLPGWLRTVSEWNPVSSVVAACRELWGNPSVASSGSFPAQHPMLAALIMFVVLLAIAVPLSARAYRKAAAH